MGLHLTFGSTQGCTPRIASLFFILRFIDTDLSPVPSPLPFYHQTAAVPAGFMLEHSPRGEGCMAHSWAGLPIKKWAHVHYF